jgi:hypothetical protein
MSGPTGPEQAGDWAAGLPAAREALRRNLTAGGYAVASDTVSLRRELYVRGDGDRAAAMFEFYGVAADAVQAMYLGQGRWTPELPPRFAVLPAAERTAPEADFLQQAGFSVLFYEERAGAVSFVGFPEALEKMGRPAGAADTDSRRKR